MKYVIREWIKEWILDKIITKKSPFFAASLELQRQKCDIDLLLHNYVCTNLLFGHEEWIEYIYVDMKVISILLSFESTYT